MQRPAEISEANWDCLKAFAEPLEDDLNTVLTTILTTVDTHRDCHHPTRTVAVLKKPTPAAPTAPGPLTDTETHLHQKDPQQPEQQPGDPNHVDSPPPRTGAQMADIILRYLRDNGGAVVSTDIYRYMLKELEPPLGHVDLEVMVGGKTRWRKAADRGRQELKEKGFISPSTAPHSWCLTKAGWNQAKQLPEPDQDSQEQHQPAPSHTPDPTRAPADPGLPTPDPAAPAETHAQVAAPRDAEPPTPEDDPTEDNHTNQSLYHLPIMKALADASGAAPVNHVMAQVENKISSSFTTQDLQPNPGHRTRWRRTVHNARLQLIRQGYLHSPKGRGVWQLSSKGWDHLRSLTIFS